MKKIVLMRALVLLLSLTVGLTQVASKNVYARFAYKGDIPVVWNAPNSPEFWGVFIGVNDTTPLNYPDDDAIGMKNKLDEWPAWEPDHKRILLGVNPARLGNATWNDINSSITWLYNQADDHDIVVFYYSGHGGRPADNNVPADEQPPLDNFDESISPSDGVQRRDDDLMTAFKKFENKPDVGLILIFDCCHSGGMVDGNSDLQNIVNPHTILMAVERERTSAEFAPGEVGRLDPYGPAGSTITGHGIFTHYLLQGLESVGVTTRADAAANNDRITTGVELFNYARDRTRNAAADRDLDGQQDEDPEDEVDNDGDTLIDEDPAGPQQIPQVDNKDKWSYSDYGDAPDPTYPSKEASNGACHLVTAHEWLGAGVTIEADSKQVDLDENDDGVKFLGVGQIGGKWILLIEVTVSTAGTDLERWDRYRVRQENGVWKGNPLYFNAWIDWTCDGDWADPNEKVIGTGSPVGTVRLETTPIKFKVFPLYFYIEIPSGYPITNTTWARFRLDWGEDAGNRMQPWTDPSLHEYEGQAAFGEVEDYKISFPQIIPDFGDAPDPYRGAGRYPSLLVNNGARHLITTYEWLGYGVTIESDSKQVDLDEFDDGVIIGGNLVPGGHLEIMVTISTSGEIGRYNITDPNKLMYLNAWIDWNRDGDWRDAGEKIIGTGSPTGTQKFAEPAHPVYIVPIPTWVTPCEIWLRFRLDYAEDVGANPQPWTDTSLNQERGQALYGEVEDYKIKIQVCVGGFSSLTDVSIEKPDLSTTYFGFVSTILVATAVTGIYVKRVKRKEEKQ